MVAPFEDIFIDLRVPGRHGCPMMIFSRQGLVHHVVSPTYKSMTRFMELLSTFEGRVKYSVRVQFTGVMIIPVTPLACQPDPGQEV